MESTKFRLKRGYCHITEDEVLITRYQNVENFVPQSRISLVLYNLFTELLIVAVICYLTYERGYLQGNILYIFLMGIFLLLAAYRIVLNFLYSSDNHIKRSDITMVEYKENIPFITIPQFVIYYEENGKQRKRLLPLAGILHGKSARTNAMEVMQQSGLYKLGEHNEDLLDSI